MSIRPEGSGVAFSGAVQNRVHQIDANNPLVDQNTGLSLTKTENTTESHPLVNLTQQTNTQIICGHKMESNQTDTTPEDNVEEPSAESREEEEAKYKAKAQRRSYKFDDPPVIFKDVDVR